jgi:hypothetical protein
MSGSIMLEQEGGEIHTYHGGEVSLRATTSGIEVHNRA